MPTDDHPLAGRVALVAGATRGCGRAIAVELGALGATVYGSGRSTRAGRSPMDRPETIEDTAELVTAAGGEGVAVRCDHADADDVGALVERIRSDHARLDILVNDVWGGDLNPRNPLPRRSEHPRPPYQPGSGTGWNRLGTRK
jgi:NAD(P)-dependent dehydrogenase (short-subunit alcohol dehydrogenase family)